MPTPLVTEAAARDMAETAEWAAANIKRLGPVSVETAEDIASTRRALKLAGELHAAQRIEDNVGRFVGGLNYLGFYFSAIRDYVVLAYEYTPAERTEDGELCESIEIQSVWLAHRDIGAITMDHIDEFEAAIWKSRKAVQS
jgi:hypothetical protein